MPIQNEKILLIAYLGSWESFNSFEIASRIL